MIRMKMNIIYLCLGLFMLLTACNSQNTHDDNKQFTVQDSVAQVLQVRSCARIYSSEYRIHKIITNHDILKFEGHIIQKKMSISLPSGSRKIAFPIDMTLQGYTDLSLLTEKNIKIQGKSIQITLPDPQFILVSVKINRNKIIEETDLMRSRYTEEEINKFTRQGVNHAMKTLPWNELVATARTHAAHTLFPFLSKLGFTQIEIRYQEGIEQRISQRKILLKNSERP